MCAHVVHLEEEGVLQQSAAGCQSDQSQHWDEIQITLKIHVHIF